MEGNSTDVDLAVIGGGPAGMAAAAAAREQGIENIMVIERDHELGGILQQCIHNGFGLHHFREELTGPEYAQRYIEKLRREDISCRLDTMVLSIGQDRTITCINSREGLQKIKAGAIILAMGCRERTRGAINIPGTRPAGIFSAGTAQR
ncbi:MAG TPA: FAD-binding protein, partial [Firmicutes bacterium]|nr:FAD-binding protein [Bacillota bacterium]